LSLPSRIPFILATFHTPFIVMGNPRVAAARFVTRFEVGTACEYVTQDLQRAVRHVTDMETQEAMRERARRMAPVFSDLGAADWLWQALENQEPSNLKFENLFAPRPGDFVHYVEPPVPDWVHPDLQSMYQALRRLQIAGFTPDFVLAIGAAPRAWPNAAWSQAVQHLFPNARFIPVDALASRYPDEANLTPPPHFDVVETAVLDRLAEERNITGRGILNVDVRFAGHLVIEGCRALIGRNVDVIAIQSALERVHPEARTFDEIIDIMSELGFRYFDDAGKRHTPAGLLEQKRALFVRRGLLSGA